MLLKCMKNAVEVGALGKFFGYAICSQLQWSSSLNSNKKLTFKLCKLKCTSLYNEYVSRYPIILLILKLLITLQPHDADALDVKRFIFQCSSCIKFDLFMKLNSVVVVRWRYFLVACNLVQFNIGIFVYRDLLSSSIPKRAVTNLKNYSTKNDENL